MILLVVDCFAYRHRAERFCGISYSKVASVMCVCKVMQALGLIISHSFVAGVIALENTFSPSLVTGMQCVCACVRARGCRTGKMSFGQNVREMLRRNLKHNQAM
jgi:hypothetical protein